VNRAARQLRELATPLLDMSERVDYLDFHRSPDPFFRAPASLLQGAVPGRFLRRRDRNPGRLVPAPPLDTRRRSGRPRRGSPTARPTSTSRAAYDPENRCRLNQNLRPAA
jgi:hypothetical protein